MRSLARITFGSSERGGLCSGLVLSETSVLTAAHCVRGAQGADLLVEVPSAGGEPAAVVAESWREHPSLDVALIGVKLPAARLAPSWRFATREDAVRAGDRLTIAGFGVREDGGYGDLRFVEEEIVVVGPESILVDGRGITGACDGDSGGPAVSFQSSEPIVFGILSSGSASCSGVDLYVRADALEDFVSEPANRTGCDAERG